MVGQGLKAKAKEEKRKNRVTKEDKTEAKKNAALNEMKDKIAEFYGKNGVQPPEWKFDSPQGIASPFI